MSPRSKKSKNSDIGRIALFIVIIFIVVIIYLVSIGYIDFFKSKNAPDEFNESKELARRRYEKIEFLVSKKKELAKKLERIAEIVFLWVRVLFVIVLIFYNLTLYFYCDITEVGSLINWNELVVFIIAIILFLGFGQISSFDQAINSLKIRIRNIVFRKYVDIDKTILQYEFELKQLRETL